MCVKVASKLTSETRKNLHVQLSKLPVRRHVFGAVKYFNQSENHTEYNMRLCQYYAPVNYAWMAASAHF